MIYVKIGEKQFEATVQTRPSDSAWGGRESKAITIAATYAEAMALFVNDAPWSVLVQQADDDGAVVTTEQDMSAYALAGAITDNRDGTVTAKMGKYKDTELLTIPLAAAPKNHREAVALRAIVEQAASSLDDKTASTAASLFPRLKEDGALVAAGTRINWGGAIKRAAADLWDTPENNPENAPTLWEDIAYRAGYRIIPDIITAGTAFGLGEYGWWEDVLYKSLIAANVYTPDAYPAGWEIVQEV